jgi:hypothetical protein
MNLIDLHVVEVIGEPYEAYGKYWVKVLANGEGHIAPGTVMCNSLEDAQKVKPGYVFQG